VSTLVVIGVIVLAVSRSSGWPQVRQQFFDWDVLKDSLPEIARAFPTNIRIFMTAEAIVLVAGLLIAVLRSLQGPVFFPLRLFAVLYSDFFRGIPTILLVYLLGFGAPALQLSGVPTSTMFWGITALALVYTAYVSEVYRAGIDSVHPSQDAAARSLGLSRAQSLRYVVLPQAVRRVVPPLLNDFIGLQKDSALIAVLGVVEALRQAQIDTAATFNYTPYVAAALLFLALTIPLTRLTDWLIARDRRRRQASGAAA
jgi:polar amino acid transport system permease protein